MNRLHLVYGEAGAGTLRLALSTEGSKSCVVAFPAVLNYAPLFPSFDDAEIEKVLSAEFQTITLGKHILRTETAGLTILSILMFQAELNSEQ